MTFGLHVNYMQFFTETVLFQLTHEMRRRSKLEAGFHVADHYALFFKIAVSLSRMKDKTLSPSVWTTLKWTTQ